eukprot:290481_1
MERIIFTFISISFWSLSNASSRLLHEVNEPILCLAIYDPVCCNGNVQYGNACYAHGDGATGCQPGVCPANEPCACPKIWDPVCCNDGTKHMNKECAKCTGSVGCNAPKCDSFTGTITCANILCIVGTTCEQHGNQPPQCVSTRKTCNNENQCGEGFECVDDPSCNAQFFDKNGGGNGEVCASPSGDTCGGFVGAFCPNPE